MHISANENIPAAVVDALRAAGHDVCWVRTDSGGAADDAILARAVSENRVLITFEKDFGDLAFRSRLLATCGIILFRIPKRSPESLALYVTNVIQSHEDWRGWFSVVKIDRIRRRPLPSPSDNC